MKKLAASHGAILFFVVSGILAVQTRAINRPLAGHFGSYQQVMGGMAKNMLRENFSQLLYPKTDILVGGERGLHLNQYPFPSVFAAVLTRWAGHSVDFWGRFQAIFFNLLTIGLVALIAARLFDATTGWVAAVLYGFSPFAMIYGQMFFSEPLAVFCLLLSLWLLLKTGDENDAFPSLKRIGAALAFSLAVVGRVHFVLFLPALLIPLLDRSSPLKSLLRGLVFTALGLSLPVLWYGFTYVASMHSTHVLTNIFSQAAARKVGDHSFLLNLDYHRRIFDIVTETMLTPLGFSGFVIGLLTLINAARRTWVLTGIALVCGAAPLVLSPQKIMAHDFYLAGLFPFIILTAAYGIAQVGAAVPALRRPWLGLMLSALYFLVSARYFFNPIFTVPQEIRQVKATAASLQVLSAPKDEIVVAAESTASLAYYADRPVWVMQFSELGGPLAYYLHDARFTKRPAAEIAEQETAMKNAVSLLEYFKRHGAKYFAAPSRLEADQHPDLMTHLRQHYRQVSGGQEPFYIFDLSAGPAVPRGTL